MAFVGSMLLCGSIIFGGGSWICEESWRRTPVCCCTPCYRFFFRISMLRRLVVDTNITDPVTWTLHTHTHTQYLYNLNDILMSLTVKPNKLLFVCDSKFQCQNILSHWTWYHHGTTGHENSDLSTKPVKIYVMFVSGTYRSNDKTCISIILQV